MPPRRIRDPPAIPESLRCTRDSVVSPPYYWDKDGLPRLLPASDPVQELLGLLNGYKPCCLLEETFLKGHFDYGAYIQEVALLDKFELRGCDGRPADPNVFREALQHCKVGTTDIMYIPFENFTDDMHRSVQIVFHRSDVRKAAALRLLLQVAIYDFVIAEGQLAPDAGVSAAVNAYLSTPDERDYAAGILYGYEPKEIGALFAYRSLMTWGIGHAAEWWTRRQQRSIALGHLQQHRMFFDAWSKRMQKQTQRFVASQAVDKEMKRAMRQWKPLGSMTSWSPKK